jgi:hypothetical protein
VSQAFVSKTVGKFGLRRPKRVVSVLHVRDELTTELGRPPTLAEIGSRVGLTRERVRQILQAAGVNTRAFWAWKAEQRAASSVSTRAPVCPPTPARARKKAAKKKAAAPRSQSADADLGRLGARTARTRR